MRCKNKDCSSTEASKYISGVGRHCLACYDKIIAAKEAEDSKWFMNKIELELERFGDDSGKYTGKVSFANGHFESFSFRIRPDMAQGYIALIAEDLVKGATGLGDKLLESLGLTEEGVSNASK